MSVTKPQSKEQVDAVHRISVDGLVERIPVFTDEQDRLLVKNCLLRLREKEIKTALETHGSVDQSLLFLVYKYQEAHAIAQRNYRHHVAAEKNHLFESSGLAIAKAEARVEAMIGTQELLSKMQSAEAQYEFLRNMSFAARNRLRAIEHLANYERLEHKLDTSSQY